MESKPYPAGEKLRNFLSVVAGVLLFFILLFALFPLFETINGLWKPATAGSGPASYGSIGLAMLLLLSMGMAAGLLAFIISTRRAMLHAVITAMVLLLLYVLAIGKDVPWQRVLQSPKEAAVNIAVPLLLLIGPCIGGRAGGLFRRKRPLNSK